MSSLFFLRKHSWWSVIGSFNGEQVTKMWQKNRSEHINGWILYDFYFWWALIWKECQEYSAKCVLLLLSLMKLKGRTLGIIYAPSNLLSHFLEVRSIINKSINLICVNPKVIYFILSDLWTPKYDWPIQKYFISHSF